VVEKQKIGRRESWAKMGAFKIEEGVIVGEYKSRWKWNGGKINGARKKL